MSWNVRVRVPAEQYWGDLEGDALRGAKEAVEKAGDLTAGRIRQLLSRPAQAEPAAPDEPPYRRRGDLAKAVIREPAVAIESSRGNRGVSTRVMVDDPGAGRVEFGAVDVKGRRTFPHPFMRPAFEEMEPEIEALFMAWAGAA